MNWKIILQLSLFGFIMAAGTVKLIPMTIEPFFWLVIFIFSAFIIAKACKAKYFLNGFFLSLVNCIYIIFFHVMFYNIYMSNHPNMAKYPMPIAGHPRESMILTGIFVGIVCGLIVGLLAFIASKIVRKTPVAA